MEWLAGLLALLQSLSCQPQPEPAWTLRGLDHTRAVAFQSGEPRLLSDVYAPGSPLLKQERRRLLAYVRDGVTLHGMELVVTSCTVLTDDADRQVLRVTDRLLPTRAEFADGTTRALPVDRPTRRDIELKRIAGEWRIWSIRPASIKPAERP